MNSTYTQCPGANRFSIRGTGSLVPMLLALVSLMAVCHKAMAQENPIFAGQPVSEVREGEASESYSATVSDKEKRTVNGIIQIEGCVGLISDVMEDGVLNISFGYSARGGVQWGKWGAFLHVGHSLWYAYQSTTRTDAGVLNLALGAEYRYFKGRARTSLAAGTSTLLFDHLLDDAGTTGLFIDLRPVGLRFPVTKRFAISLEPLTFVLMAPVLSKERKIVQLIYRSMLILEFEI